MHSTALLLFNILCIISVICVLLLLIIYIRVGRSSLLICCSVVLLVMFGTIFAGTIKYGNDMELAHNFCVPQGIILNYCFISAHALVACVMFDAWAHVSNWRSRRVRTQTGTQTKRNCSLGYLTISFGIPAVPTLALIVCNSQPGMIQPRAYFCYIAGSLDIKLATSTGWFILFSVPGMFFSVYLLFRTAWMREKSLLRGRTTHLTRSSVARIVLATFVYSSISISSYLPTLILYHDDLKSPNMTNRPPISSNAQSPYQNPSLCHAPLNNPQLAYYANQRCSGMTSFIPCLVGIGFFLMYGFGKYARKTYVDFYHKLRHISLVHTLFKHVLSRHQLTKVAPTRVAGNAGIDMTVYPDCLEEECHSIDGRFVRQITRPQRKRRPRMRAASSTFATKCHSHISNEEAVGRMLASNLSGGLTAYEMLYGMALSGDELLHARGLENSYSLSLPLVHHGKRKSWVMEDAPFMHQYAVDKDLFDQYSKNALEGLFLSQDDDSLAPKRSIPSHLWSSPFKASNLQQISHVDSAKFSADTIHPLDDKFMSMTSQLHTTKSLHSPTHIGPMRQTLFSLVPQTPDLPLPETMTISPHIVYRPFTPEDDTATQFLNYVDQPSKESIPTWPIFENHPVSPK